MSDIDPAEALRMCREVSTSTGWTREGVALVAASFLALHAELERRQAVEERLHAALAKKWEFHLVAYPHASPYVEVWRKGGRFSIHSSASLQQALEDAVAITEGA